MKNLLSILSLLLIFISCNSVNTGGKVKSLQKTKVGYNKQLLALFDSIDNDVILKDEYLEKIIPTSIGDYDVYYTYYNDSQFSGSLNVLNDEIGLFASRGHQKIFEKYILTYRFLNIEKYGEEYVEKVFYDIEFTIGKNIDLFCDLYQKYDDEIKKEMLEFYEIYCAN